MAAGLLVAGVTLDWWAPALAMRWAGVTSGRSETHAGRTTVVENVAWTGVGLSVQAKRVELSSAWMILRTGKVGAEASGWVVEVSRRAGGDDAKGRRGGAWETWVPELRRVAREMERRLGEVVLRDGVVRAAGEEIAVERLWVKGGVVNLLGRVRGQTFEVDADLALGTVSAHWMEPDLRLAAEFWPERARAELTWAGNTATAGAVFAPGTWLPTTLRVKGADWRVPAERLGLGRVYGDLLATFELDRQGAGLAGSLDAVAKPREAGLPEMRVSLAGAAGMDWVRVERVLIEAREARARLSAPIEWRRGAGWSGEGEPVFAWDADLGALSGGTVRGHTEGTARWVASAEGARVRWEARGTELGWREFAGVTLRAKGESTAEATTVAEAELRAADGARVAARGRVVHATRTLEGGALSAKISGLLLRPWLPAGAALESGEAELRVAGVWPELTGEGTLRATKAEYAGWAADAIAAQVSGTQGKFLSGAVTAERGAAKISMRGETGGGEARMADFSLRRSDGAELHAVSRGVFRWAGAARRVQADLAGPGETRVSLDWSEGGAARVLIQDLNTTWARDWMTGSAVPELTVRRLSATGKAGAGEIIEGAGVFDVAGRLAGRAVWARGEGRLGPEGARLVKLESGGEREAGSASAAEVLVAGSGSIPWRLRGETRIEAEPVAGGLWDLRFESKAGAGWWDELAKVVNLELKEPTLRLRVEGEATAPRGSMAFGAERVGLHGEDFPEGGLELQALRAEAELERGEVLLRRLEATVDGQRVEAEGRLALADGDWARLRARPYLWLRDHAEARVTVPGAEVAAFARYLPTLLAPQGVMTAELRLTPGARLDGILGLSGAATRPLGGFGVLQEVEVRLALSGMDVRIEKMRAMAGGQEVVVTGGARRVPGKIPVLDLAVKAERFPLVRKPGLLLRGDLDLTVKTAENGRTKVGGEVRLRDSLFLADIRPLLTPGGGRGAAAARARPPYFSVENPPLADWELGLRVAGQSFLRLRTPVFEGVGSARFDLAGTMREPRAVGEFWVERGNILFPFATFAVQEGAVRLKASDPYTPALDFRATGRRLGYDLRLELGGTAEAPQLQLTSSPPLEAETVLLMVTAGTAPEQGVGAASGAQRLAAVGAYVGRDLLRTLGVGGADEERLTLSSGEKVSRAGRETYGFEFKLNDNWALTGEYDEFDAYNVGLKRRFGPRDEDLSNGDAEKRDDKKEADDAR